MKKTFIYLAFLVAAVACSTEEWNSEFPLNGEKPASGGSMITEIVSGQHGSSTKATISNDDAPAFAWTKGDNIAVHVTNGDSHKYVFTSGAGGASVAAATADFAVSYEEGYARDAFAVFPSSIVNENSANYGQSGKALDLTLPASYTLSQVTGETTPCPMIATNAPSSGWTFYQICGLLRLTVNSIPPSTKRLEIAFNGKKVWGVFSIASPVSPGSSAIETADDPDHDVITITKDGTDVTLNNGKWLDGQVLNIPLPIGDYTQVTLTAYNALTGGDAVLTMTRPFAYTASQKFGTRKTASFPVFSINGTRQNRVIFSPGNLRATTSDKGATWTWGFAPEQYAFIGNGGANTKINGKGTVSENGTVDLFGWSTANTAYGIYNSTDYNDYKGGDFLDWGGIALFDGVSYPSDYWRVLSCHSDNNYEWWYMLRTRATGATVNQVGNARFTQATINSDGTPVNGLIVFPDYYTGPSESSTDITWGDKINDYNGSKGTWPDWGGTSCTCAGWKTLEAEGCVFLPAAGWRSGVTVSFDWNYYASKTQAGDDNYAWRVFQFSSRGGNYNMYWDMMEPKHQSAAVRLVHDVK